jgi:hypothetical protein
MKSSLFSKSLGLLFLGLVVLLADCTKKEAPKMDPVPVPQTTAKFEVTRDEFENTTRYSMMYNYLPDDSTKPAPNLTEVMKTKDLSLIEFDAFGSRKEKGKFHYFLLVSYIGKDWLFVNNSYESLFLIIDGQRVGLTCFSCDRQVSSLKYIEMLFYPVEFDFLVKISKAKNVKVKLRGSRGAEIRFFAKENFNNFAEFVKKFGPDEILKGQGEGPKEEKR